MALIRNAAASTLARDAIVLDLGDLQRQGELLKRRAREEAEQTLAAARRERDRLVAGAAEEGRAAGAAEGRAQGLAEGREQGRAEAMEERRAELEALIGGWTAALEEFNARRERMLSEARVDVLKLALQIAERITRRAIQHDPAVVQDQIRAVLAAVARPTRLTLCVHPEDAPIASEILPEVHAAMGEHAELVVDAALERGSCIARTEEGAKIDASIETQLRRIVEALLPGRGDVLEHAEDDAGAPPGAPGDEGP